MHLHCLPAASTCRKHSTGGYWQDWQDGKAQVGGCSAALWTQSASVPCTVTVHIGPEVLPEYSGI